MVGLENFIGPIKTAAIFFPMLAALLTVPYLIREYHKYGAVYWMKVFLYFSFMYYMLTIYLLVILPLPARDTIVRGNYAEHIQPYPFYYIFTFIRDEGLSIQSIYGFINSFKFWQLAFNVIMVFPFGVYLRYYFKKGMLFSLLASFLLSLFFELTQLSGIYGIYPGCYRMADMDDLICNTLGGFLGYIVAPSLVFFLPKRDKLDKKARSKAKYVTGMRKIIASLIDAVIFGVVWAMFTSIAVVLDLGIMDHINWINGYIFVYLMLSFLLCTFTKRQTPGKYICNLKLVNEKGKSPSILSLFCRYGIVTVELVGCVLLADMLKGVYDGASIKFFKYFIGFLWTVCDLLPVVFVIRYSICHVFLKREMTYEKISKTHYESTI